MTTDIHSQDFNTPGESNNFEKYPVMISFQPSTIISIITLNLTDASGEIYLKTQRVCQKRLLSG